MGSRTDPEPAHAPLLVVLAAGASRRLGRPKALVPLRDDPPATPLSLLLEAGALVGPDPPLVVAGADLAAIREHAPAGAVVVANPRWREGRTGSVARAAEARPGRDLCLAPVDVPAVPPEVFRALADAWREAGAPARGWLAPWVRTAAGARHGHPVVLGRDLAAELRAWPSDRPLRELRRRAGPLLGVEVRSRAILDDLDRPEDLEALRRRLGAPSPPPTGWMA